LIASLAAAAVLQAGRLVDAPALRGDHAALLVQENIPVDQNWTRDNFERTLRELTDLSVASFLDRDKTPFQLDLIVWPESPAPFFTSDPLFRDPVSEMARKTGTWVVTGAIGTTSAMQGGEVSFAGFQLSCARESCRRLGGTLRQSASGAFRRIPAVP
jgi:apolipoprotein N-acyltransferase